MEYRIIGLVVMCTVNKAVDDFVLHTGLVSYSFAFMLRSTGVVMRSEVLVIGLNSRNICLTALLWTFSMSDLNFNLVRVPDY